MERCVLCDAPVAEGSIRWVEGVGAPFSRGWFCEPHGRQVFDEGGWIERTDDGRRLLRVLEPIRSTRFFV